ncbi:aldo/keto reductase [Sediminitomix flava]|uniref:Aryl-alcohol dehydrogenase-like predicted oxidoreductase n=1 Tax=Sediminitomix flava TaxID=379075 RepID=A0A315ZHI7_SEDFL|nr:aldo/keto reductase [Sediminitomix flava]PWJ45075.1 aryl-alcohol dehydrogenase-like predicted oxidoreductase [Sediminitomix flava]
MKLRELGNTGLQVSPIGLGTAALGRPGYINLGHGADLAEQNSVQAMEQRMHQMLAIAYQKGIRYFDAARSYGKAEEFLHSWFQKNPSSKDLVIGSKWGYTYTADWSISAEKHEVKEHSLVNLQKQWAESQSLLKNYLDIYQIHSATIDSGVLDNQEVLDQLWKYKEEGVKIGLSLSGIKQNETLDKALEIQYNSELLFDTVQVTWNILESVLSPYLEKAAQQGMGVIVKEGVANGRLTSRNVEADFVEKKQVLAEIAANHNVEIDAVALAVILHQKWCGVALSGASTEEQLQSNLNAVDLKFSTKELSTLLSLAESSEDYWAKRSALAWN